MKQCLIVGAGTRFGRELTLHLLGDGYHVHLVTSAGKDWDNVENVTVINVNWSEVTISSLRSLIPNTDHLDLIFFNHNASALSHPKFNKSAMQRPQDWQNAYFTACQLPYYLVHALGNKITPDTKVVWMLSELIKIVPNHQVGYADYIGNKFTNACIMRAFSVNYPACFFGVHPKGGLYTEQDWTEKSQNIVRLLNTKTAQELNGRIFSTEGELLDIYAPSLD
jgi:NAD(P)-dependent dehydrogenase (short-subunit alcohol dehydrogenase family)